MAGMPRLVVPDYPHHVRSVGIEVVLLTTGPGVIKHPGTYIGQRERRYS